MDDKNLNLENELLYGKVKDTVDSETIANKEEVNNGSTSEPNFVFVNSVSQEEINNTLISEEVFPNVNIMDDLKTIEATGFSTVEDLPKKNRIPKKKHKFFRKAAGLLTSAAVFGLVAGVCFQYINQDGFQKTQSNIQLKPINEIESDQTVNTTTSQSTDSNSVISTSNGVATVMDVSGVVDNVMPAIVAINSSTTQTSYDFFGREYNNEVSGSGSGIIIGQNDSEVLIVTNNHVIENATAIEIVFNDETKAVATLKGTEASSDLAVVSVNVSDLTDETKNNIKIATLGNSDEVKTGEMAIAIGNALGYGQSVTVGYISALDREVTVDDVTLNLIQTDAAINPGNSGGALLNANGEVIGINSVKYSDTEVEGIGYAIPISDAIPIINDLMNREELAAGESAYLGISAKNISAGYAEAFSMPVGVYVSSVEEGSPAEKAGIKQYDIITAIDGETIEDMDELVSFLSYTKGGTSVELTVSVLENGSYVEKKIDVELGYRPSDAN